MKKKYIYPSLQMTELSVMQPLAGSNEVNSTGVTINTETIKEGDGGDGAKSRDNGSWSSLW